MTYLDLSHNHLESLVDVFEGVTQLNIVDLSFNFIKIFENKFELQIVDIILESNAMKVIKSNWINVSFISNLEILKLGFNGLFLIENEDFFRLVMLKHGYKDLIFVSSLYFRPNDRYNYF